MTAKIAKRSPNLGCTLTEALIVFAFLTTIVYLIMIRSDTNWGAAGRQEIDDTPPILNLKFLKQPLSYNVCNGLSNQLLGHAAFISSAIVAKRDILIPDVYIMNGVQTVKKDDVLVNVLTNNQNAMPLSKVVDTDVLISVIEQHGIRARLEPFENVISRNMQSDGTCAWLAALRESDNDITLQILQSIKPSKVFSSLIDTSLENLLTLRKSSNATISDGICLHHRDAEDWYKHCEQWENIKDGVWRKNCLNDRNLPLIDLIKYRIPTTSKKSWIYYVGDYEPTPKIIQEFKDKNLDLVHRKKHSLLMNDDIAKSLDLASISEQSHRDLFSIIDFFTCSQIDSFIGNSVSAFSSNQIAIRGGMNSAWYNSRSIPVADFFQVFYIPIVYTYTEKSQELGKSLLKASILSARSTFGLTTDIHILYHGTEDKQFLEWLTNHNVIIHNHEPNWLDKIEEMRQNGNSKYSHLFAHSGNYIGTWQRIDIPLFINAEYCLFLDSDTIVHERFGMHDFGLEITPGLAASAEFDEDFLQPWNVGVTLFNVPKLRETHADFLEFIWSHIDNPRFKDDNISDQGAYLEYYAKEATFLNKKFNVKPYWLGQIPFDQRKVIHFHGLKPHDILRIWTGKQDKFSDAFTPLIDNILYKAKKKNVCVIMHEFSKYLYEDQDNLDQYCHVIFMDDKGEEDLCVKFFTFMAGKEGSSASCRDKFFPTKQSEIKYNSISNK